MKAVRAHLRNGFLMAIVICGSMAGFATGPGTGGGGGGDRPDITRSADSANIIDKRLREASRDSLLGLPTLEPVFVEPESSLVVRVRDQEIHVVIQF